MAGFAFDGALRRRLMHAGVAAAAAMVATGVASAADDLADVKAAIAKNHSAAVKRPELLAEAARAFGAQCVVLSMDVMRTAPTPAIPSGFEVVIHGGRLRQGGGRAD